MTPTIEEISKAPAHVMREWAAQGLLKQFWKERRYFSLGLFLDRVAESPATYGFKNLSALCLKFGITLMHLSRTVYRRGDILRLTLQEMGEIETRSHYIDSLMYVFRVSRTREEVFYHVQFQYNELDSLRKRAITQERRKAIIRMHTRPSISAIVDGLIRTIQREFALTPDDALVIPFLLYKVTVEAKPAQQYTRLKEMLASLNLNPDIAGKILPQDAWRATKGKGAATERDFAIIRGGKNK